MTGLAPDLEPDDDELLAEAEERSRAEAALAVADAEWADAAERVVDELMERAGERSPEPRLHATRRAVELLGDVHRAYPVIHLTGTNGKTSTARMIESLLRAHGLRTGLLTSPHLERLNERMCIDGAPVTNERLAANWADVKPFIELVDTELEAAGEVPLTYFEALTVLAAAVFADAPVDVAVIEVGMGGEWDATNVFDGQVAVFTPIGLDHADRLGGTVAEIATTKAGIIKAGAHVVTAAQQPEALATIEAAARERDAAVSVAGSAFSLDSDTVAIGGRLVSVRGLAADYRDLFLPLHGAHQAANAALALVAVEAFFGGTRALPAEFVTEGLAAVTSPGRLERIGTRPSVFVDAAHNPHGAATLVAALEEGFDLGEVVAVVAVLDDKDAEGILREVARVATRIIVTESSSPRVMPAEELAERARAWVSVPIEAQPVLEDAVALARSIAASADAGGSGRPAGAGAEAEGHDADLDAEVAANIPMPNAAEVERAAATARSASAVLVTGSITLVGDVLTLAREEGWLQR